MRKIFTAFLFVSFINSVFADVFTADTVCTWTPWNTHYVDIDNNNWFSECDGQSVTGISLCASQSGVIGDTLKSQPIIDSSEDRNANNVHCWCKMTMPYEGLWVYHGVYGTLEMYCDGSSPMAYMKEICSSHCAELWMLKDSGNAYLDNYGHGFMGTAIELAAIKTGLFTPALVETPCEIGISRLMVSTGDAFRLWAEKYTEPSLVVQYNDEKCYVKLESGVGKLNINYNGEIYHAVE